MNLQSFALINLQEDQLVFSDTDVPTQKLFDYLIQGRTLNDFLADYSNVSKEKAEDLLKIVSQLLTKDTKQPSMEPKELHIEWQSLRGEILELDKACLTILQYGLVVSGAAIGFLAKHLSDKKVTLTAAIESSNSLMVTLILLSGIWILAYNYLYHKRLSSRRIASYLRFYVEDKSNTPKWETRVQFYRDVRCWQAGINTEKIEKWISLLVQVVIVGISGWRIGKIIFISSATWDTGAKLSLFGLLFSLSSIIFTIHLYEFLKKFNYANEDYRNAEKHNKSKFKTSEEIWVAVSEKENDNDRPKRRTASNK